MNIKPLILNLTDDNKPMDEYFPGKYGARKQIDMNLKKFIPLKRLFLRKRQYIYTKNNHIRSSEITNNQNKKTKNNI
jgi:hypothetical protein